MNLSVSVPESGIKSQYKSPNRAGHSEPPHSVHHWRAKGGGGGRGPSRAGSDGPLPPDGRPSSTSRQLQQLSQAPELRPSGASARPRTLSSDVMIRSPTRASPSKTVSKIE